MPVDEADDESEAEDVTGADAGFRYNKQITDIEVHFRLDIYDLDLGYMGNETSLRNFAHKIDSIGIANIDSIVIVSQSSPEGVYEHNLMLSRNRAKTMRKYLLDTHPELSGLLYVHPDGESWARLREYVRKDTLMKNSTIERVLSTIDADINIGTKKWRMEQLPVYKYLLMTYYPRIRNSVFCIIYHRQFNPVAIIDTVSVASHSPIAGTIPAFMHSFSGVQRWVPELHLKTNFIGLGLAISNVAVEADLTKHLSVTLPIYYSAWNYFKTTIKFRTFSLQPELRYWLSEDNDGFFVGAHFGYVQYNFAFDGEYRYQDHYRKTPSIGGGVSIGYRLPLDKEECWKMELTLGAGGYSRHYDIFQNTPVTKDGLLLESIKDSYWGIDQAAITLAYSFDLKARGGRR